MKKHSLLVFFLTVFFITSNAQTSRSNPTDWEAWGSFGLNIDLPKKWNFELEYQHRVDSNLLRDKGEYFNAEISRKLNKKMRGFVNYRFANTVNGNSSRVGIGVEYKEKISKWEFSFRPQWQYTLQYANDGESSSQRGLLRSRLMASRNLPGRYEAYASIEPFFTFDKTEYFIDNFRNTFGLKYKSEKGHKVDLFYIYRPDFAKSYNRYFNILGIKLEYSLK
jgi:hypothetical protein